MLPQFQHNTFDIKITCYYRLAKFAKYKNFCCFMNSQFSNAIQPTNYQPSNPPSPTNNQIPQQQHPTAQVSATITNQTDLQQLALINNLRSELQKINRQSVDKDKQISNLKHSVFQQGQQITSLQRQVEGLENMLTKLLTRKEYQYKRFWDERSNLSGKKGYHLQTTQLQSVIDKQLMLSLSEVNMKNSRKEESFLQSSRIVSTLSNSRKSRREELMQCQSITDVYRLPQYRHG